MFQAQFYLEQNEDCSLGDGISDISEKLLQRNKGEICICDFGESCNQAHDFCQRLLLVWLPQWLSGKESVWNLERW